MYDIIYWLGQYHVGDKKSEELLNRAYLALENQDIEACTLAVLQLVEEVEEPVPAKFRRSIEKNCQQAIDKVERLAKDKDMDIASYLKSQQGGALPAWGWPVIGASSAVILVGFLFWLWRRRRAIRPAQLQREMLQFGTQAMPAQFARANDPQSAEEIAMAQREYAASQKPSVVYSQLPDRAIAASAAGLAVPQLAAPELARAQEVADNLAWRQAQVYHRGR